VLHQHASDPSRAAPHLFLLHHLHHPPQPRFLSPLQLSTTVSPINPHYNDPYLNRIHLLYSDELLVFVFFGQARLLLLLRLLRFFAACIEGSAKNCFEAKPTIDNITLPLPLTTCVSTIIINDSRLTTVSFSTRRPLDNRHRSFDLLRFFTSSTPIFHDPRTFDTRDERKIN
jgi:hypothetical protein